MENYFSPVLEPADTTSNPMENTMTAVSQERKQVAAIRRSAFAHGEKLGNFAADISNVIDRLTNLREQVYANKRVTHRLEMQNNLAACREVAKTERLERLDVEALYEAVKLLRAESIEVNTDRSRLAKDLF